MRKNNHRRLLSLEDLPYDILHVFHVTYDGSLPKYDFYYSPSKDEYYEPRFFPNKYNKKGYIVRFAVNEPRPREIFVATTDLEGEHEYWDAQIDYLKHTNQLD